MSSRRILIFSMLLATLLVPAFSHSDRGAPVGKKVYVSENGDYRLAVDPRSETLSEPTKPLLTLDHHSRGMIWVRQPSVVSHK
jgi:hypothetical protein